MERSLSSVKTPDSDWYMLTVTYSKCIGYKPEFQFYSTIEFVYKLLYQCSKNFEINPELTKNGKLHYHILFQIHDYIKYFKQCLPALKRNCGFTDVQQVKNIQAMKDYVKKDRNIMIELLKTELPITHSLVDKVKYYTPYRRSNKDEYKTLKERYENENDTIKKVSILNYVKRLSEYNDDDWDIETLRSAL